MNSNLIVRHEANFLPIEDPRPLMFFITFFRCLHHFYRDSVQTKDFLNTFFPFLNQYIPYNDCQTFVFRRDVRWDGVTTVLFCSSV